jgi:hypothetical protein
VDAEAQDPVSPIKEDRKKTQAGTVRLRPEKKAYAARRISSKTGPFGNETGIPFVLSFGYVLFIRRCAGYFLPSAGRAWFVDNYCAAAVKYLRAVYPIIQTQED